jgi:hypothetical protein
VVEITTRKNNILEGGRTLKSKKLKKFKGRSYHHLKNRCKGGSNRLDNLLLIHIERHEAWHKLFRNLDLSEAISLLIRLERMKGAESARARNRENNRFIGER